MKKFTFYTTLIIECAVVAGALFVVIYAFVFQFHEVSGESMFPNFKNKEYVLTSLLPARLNSLKKGDVVVFHSPIDQDRLYIKRIIALPGDTVSIQRSRVYVNGGLLNESAYLVPTTRTSGAQFLRDNQTKRVLEGTVFVLGDNRDNSSDSREWGFLEKKRVVGRSMYRVWPITEFKIIKNPY